MRVSSCSCEVYMATRGYIKKGVGKGAYYVSREPYKSLFATLLECSPYPGTLNVELADTRHSVFLEKLLETRGPCFIYAPREPSLGRVCILEALVYGIIPSLVVIPERGVHNYPQVLEIVSCTRLQDYATSVGGNVYLVIGCGLIRCLNSWRTSILRFTSSIL